MYLFGGNSYKRFHDLWMLSNNQWENLGEDYQFDYSNHFLHEYRNLIYFFPKKIDSSVLIVKIIDIENRRMEDNIKV